MTTTQELNKAVLSGDRPSLYEGNAEPAFPGMVDLMFDSWKQSSAERPTADEVGTEVLVYGGLEIMTIKVSSENRSDLEAPHFPQKMGL